MTKTKKLTASIFLAVLLLVGAGMYAKVRADTTALSPYSWDRGLFATTSQYNDSVHAWGMRATEGAWGTGPVNYQSGSTIKYRANAPGTVEFMMNATYCPDGVCSYGAGSGYKGFVQFWNDPNNYVAFGLIHDPGVSPTGTTLMVEGAANGKPIGGYWSNNGVTGKAHHIRANWNGAAVTFILDNQVELSYPVATTNPSISFLGAARNTGDIVDVTFNDITFSSGSVVADQLTVPASTPYASYSATIRDGGTGTGHSAYINTHDAHNNALAVGIQTDFGSPESQGAPYFVWEKVQNGQFTYGYVKPASYNQEPVTLKWWKQEKVAGFYAGSELIAVIPLNLEPRLYFNAEGNARLNGDSVDSSISNVQIAVGDNCPTYCGLNGTWNTSDFNFYGLQATRTNSSTQNGANFDITGTVSGLPPNGDWDSHLVAGIGMIAQYWDGQ